MIVSEALARIADDSSVNTNVSGVSARLLRHLNRVCEEVWDSFRWSFRWKNYRIVTDVDYATGTVEATNGSRTVTITGGTFSASHVGWHITFPGDTVQSWYKVQTLSSSSVVILDAPYQGTTGSGKQFILRHFDYVLPTEPWDLANVNVTSDNRVLKIFEPSSLDILGPTPLYKGYPEAISIYGSDSFPTNYSTGTVSGSVNSQILNGSGTTWLSNIYPGDIVKIGSYKYTVQKVDSDTQITLYNFQQIASSGATYTITRQFGRLIRVMWPSNNNYVLDIRALRKYAQLVDANDTNELLYRLPNAIISMASALELKGGDDRRSTQLSLMADSMISKAKAEDEATIPREHIAPIFSYRGGYGSSYRGVPRP